TAQSEPVWLYGFANVSAQASKQYYNDSEVNLTLNAYYLASKPTITLHPVYTDVGTSGWGENWHFPVRVEDPDYYGQLGSSLKVNLWINLTGAWQLIQTQTCTPSGGYCDLDFTGISFVCNRTYSDIGTKDFKFNVTDNFNYTDEDTSSITITEDQADVADVKFSKSTISREGGDSAWFAAKFYDAIRGVEIAEENVGGRIYITTDGTNYLFNQSLLSQSDGYFNYTFNPDCSFSAGPQKWKIDLEDRCYFVASAGDQSFAIIGQLKNYLVEPPYGSNVLIEVGKTLNVTSRVEDECGNLIENATVTHEALWPTSLWESIEPVTELGNGLYNSSWNLTFKAGGSYSFRVNSSKEYYYSNSTTFEDWVYLNNTPPIVENFSVSPNPGMWGEVFTYKADIYDPQMDNVTCKLFVSTDGGNTWELKNSTLIEWGRGTCKLTTTFDCAAIGTDNYYVFEIDDGTNKFNTSMQYGPNITKNSIVVSYVFGNESVVYRKGTNKTLLVLKFFDPVRKLPAENVRGIVWVTSDKQNFDSGTVNYTNSSGYLNIYFDPSYHEVGRQLWKGGSYQDSCYFGNTTIENYTLTVIGSLDVNVTLLAPVPELNAYLKPEENVTFVIKVTDDNNNLIENATINQTFIHETGWEKYCYYWWEVGYGEYRCSINTSELKARSYNTTTRVSKQYYEDGISYDFDPTLGYMFFVKTKPTLYGTWISSEQGGNIGGWGETWTFRVNVTDEDMDNVTVYLKIRKLPDGTPIQANQTLVISPINKTVILTYFDPFTFQTQQGDWEFWFEAIDSSIWQYSDTTLPQNFTIERDDVALEYVEGDNVLVWRNGTSGAVKLVVRVKDLDRDEYISSQNVTFYVTVDGVNYDKGRWLFSDSNGFANYSFKPDCNYQVGQQKWFARIYNDKYYKDVNSSEFTLAIKSYLATRVEYPQGVAFLRGSLIPINISLSDDCYLVPGASVSIWARYYSTNYPCAPVADQGNGYYNCTWDSTDRPFGWYGIRVAASETYHASNDTIETNRFFIASAPSLSNPSITPEIGGWGEEYTFKVYLTDVDGTRNNVSLWKSKDNITWELVDSVSVIPAYNNYPIIFKERFQCDDIGLNYYKFTAVDQYGFSDETEVKNFTLTYDNVTISVDSSSFTQVRRIGTQKALLKVRIYDSDLGVYPNGTNITFWVTEDYSEYSVSASNTTTLGYAEFYYDPSCASLVGTQKWVAGVTDYCYQPLNTSPTDLDVIGQLYINIIYPSVNEIFNRHEEEMLNASVYDECSQEVSDADVSWYISNNQIASGYNTSWTVPSNYELGPETIKVNATRSYYDPNENHTTILIYGWANVSEISPVNGTHVLAGDAVQITCKVIDGDIGSPIENYTVSFYKNGTLLPGGTQKTDSEGIARVTWFTSGEVDGWYLITCNITNDDEKYYNVSLKEQNSLIKVDRQLIIDSIEWQYRTIYRNDSFEPYNSALTVHVKDANTGKIPNATVYFYNDTSKVAECNITSDSDGYCSIVFNPPDTLTPGVYTLWINATTTQEGIRNSSTNTTTYVAQGKLFLTIVSPQNSTQFAKSDTIDLIAEVRSENGEDIATLYPSSYVNWYNPEGLIGVAYPSGSYTYSTTYSLAYEQTGWRKLTANITVPYFDKGENSTWILVSAEAEVVWASPPDQSEVPYPDTFYPTCLVRDIASGSGIANYPVNISYALTPNNWISLGIYLTNSSGYANASYTPTDKGTVYFLCQIWNNVTLNAVAKTPNDTATIYVKDVRPPVITDISIVPNESLEANLDSANITAKVIDDYGVDEVWAYIIYPDNTTENTTMSNISSNYYSALFTPPIGGIYEVYIYAKDKPPESNTNYTFAGYIQAYGKVYGRVENTPEYKLAINVTQVSGYTFDLIVNFTNLGPKNAYHVNLTIQESPSAGYIAFNSTFYSCGNLAPNEYCEFPVKVTVKPKTPPTTISLISNATWRNPDLSTNFTSDVTVVEVASNPVIDITQDYVEAIVKHGTTENIANLTIRSLGNDLVENVTIYYDVNSQFEQNCPFCKIEFIPDVIGDMPAGTSKNVTVKVSVPPGQNPGFYWTNVFADSDNAGYDKALFNVPVPRDNRWKVEPTDLGTVLAPPNTAGYIATLNLTNLGNIKLSSSLYKVGDIAP
ncbi:MAG: hypothetical protein DRP74_07430, partial [Candidatus Omnitrophota bacterium]